MISGINILGVINEQGIERSQLTILQGLMKLRQICDSPSIMNETVEKYPNVSIKLDELGREITENIGNHKALDLLAVPGHAGTDQGETD
jgi:SNF2 family DNA or RNA helicase